MLPPSQSNDHWRERYAPPNAVGTWIADRLTDRDHARFVTMDRQHGQQVELRVARAEAFRPDGFYRFQTETEILSGVDAESFLRPTDWGYEGGLVFGVRRHIEAPSLWALVDASNNGAPQHRFSLTQSLIIARDTLEALRHVHQSGCVYRNVCGSKILVDGSRAYLTCPSPEDYLESAGAQNVGDIELAMFASPERSGSIEHDIGPSSDLYSIGVLLFTMLAGRPPFGGDTIGSILFQHIASDPNVELLGKDVPPIVVEIIGRLLKKEPRDRYQSAVAALADIEHVLEELQHNRHLERFVIGRQDTRNSIIEPAFVGRTEELAALESCLRQVAGGEHQQVSILCPSGIGKSRLVLETIRSATRQGFLVFRSLASNQASQIPTAPLRAIVDQLVSQVRAGADLCRRLQQELLASREEIATVFPDLADALGWESAAQADPESLGKTRLETAFCQIFAHLGDGERPAFIWVDDCQWLDAQSLSILEKLQHARPKYSLFIFSMRPDEGVSASFCDRIESNVVIHLNALGNEEVRAMIESMAGRLPQEAVQTVIKLAAGSPFMASAILRGMSESGALFPSPTGWQVDRERLQRIQASANAAEALLQRLENVPQIVLTQLTVAAIIGKEFDEKTVVELSPISLKESKSCFEWSRQQRLVWSMPNGNFTFAHDKIRETLIARLSPSKRKQIHLLYAEHLNRLQTDCSFELAYHYFSAESYGEALPHAVQAAETARRLHSLDRAEELLRIALHGLDSADQKTRHQVHAGLADVLMLAGKYDEAEHWFEVSLQTVQSPLEMARIGLKRGELAFKRGDKENAVRLFSEALSELNEKVPTGRFSLWTRLLREIVAQCLHTLFPRWFLGTLGDAPSEASRLSWRLHSRIAHGFWYTKDKFHVLWAHLREMNLSERYAPTPELGQAYSEHAPAMSLIPWHQRGIDYVQRSLKIRESLNDIWGQGQSRNFFSILLYSSSQFERCIQQASHAESILLRTGDYWEVNIARYQLAGSLYRMGDLKGALEVARRTYDSALAIGDYQSTGNIIDVWVRAALCEMPDELLAAEKTRTLRDRQGECQVLLAEGIQQFGKKRYTEAVATFRKAIGIAEKAGVVNTFITPNYPWLATALRMEFEANLPRSRAARRRALRVLYRAARRAVRVARPFQNDLPHALRELGVASGFIGRGQAARRALDESASVARKQKAEYELALTQQMFGEIGREFGWPDAESIGRLGADRLRELRQPIRQSGHRESMSLFDRFDTLLEAGRQIISANSVAAIFERTVDAAKRLLRGQRTLIVAAQAEGSGEWSSLGLEQEFDPGLVLQARESNKTIVSAQEHFQQNGQPICRSGTFLCCPITVHGRIVACLYLANEFLTGLFGKNEIRIADYLASAAGGALEKADGFRQLEQLNASLEQKVLERTATVEARSRELEITANELIATQSKLELARDDAESANAAKSEFLARMSHEIRTPISAILGFTELMLRGVVRDPSESVRKLETIQANGTHLLQLINDLLDLSKIEADKMEVESIECVPVQVLHEVVTSLQVRADQKAIGLEMKIQGLVPRTIKSDPMRLRQILTNLVGNALKFTSQGQVTVTMRFSDLEAEAKNERTPERRGHVIFEIVDSGIGMSPNQLEKIFDPFTQADSSVTRQFGGTGLGLSISKQLAEALGGGISVASQLGVGSTFTVHVDAGPSHDLDLLDEVAANAYLGRETARRWYRADLSGCRVLVADDVSTNREMLSLILEDSGASVTLAVNGQEAVDLTLGHGDFDLVLMDMQMPVLDGYSATRALRRQGFDRPIIALTANTMRGDEDKCLDAGCTDYVSKPIDINCLLQKVAERHGSDLIELDNEWPTRKPMPMAHMSERNGQGRAEAVAESSRQPFEPVPDDEPFRSFALELIERIEGHREELNQAFERRDFEAISQVAHWIKGTGGSVGLPRLSVIGQTLEQAAKSRSLKRLEESLESLWHHLAKLKPPVSS